MAGASERQKNVAPIVTKAMADAGEWWLDHQYDLHDGCMPVDRREMAVELFKVMAAKQ